MGVFPRLVSTKKNGQFQGLCENLPEGISSIYHLQISKSLFPCLITGKDHGDEPAHNHWGEPTRRCYMALHKWLGARSSACSIGVRCFGCWIHFENGPCFDFLANWDLNGRHLGYHRVQWWIVVEWLVHLGNPCQGWEFTSLFGQTKKNKHRKSWRMIMIHQPSLTSNHHLP